MALGHHPPCATELSVPLSLTATSLVQEAE